MMAFALIVAVASSIYLADMPNPKYEPAALRVEKRCGNLDPQRVDELKKLAAQLHSEGKNRSRAQEVRRDHCREWSTDLKACGIAIVALQFTPSTIPHPPEYGPPFELVDGERLALMTGTVIDLIFQSVCFCVAIQGWYTPAISFARFACSNTYDDAEFRITLASIEQMAANGKSRGAILKFMRRRFEGAHAKDMQHNSCFKAMATVAQQVSDRGKYEWTPECASALAEQQERERLKQERLAERLAQEQWAREAPLRKRRAAMEIVDSACTNTCSCQGGMTCESGVGKSETRKYVRILRKDQRDGVVRFYNIQWFNYWVNCEYFTQADATLCRQAIEDYVAKYPHDDNDPPRLDGDAD